MIGAGVLVGSLPKGSLAPLAYDFRAVFHLSLHDIGVGVSWGEAVLLLQELVTVETSRTFKALHNMAYSATRAEAYILSLLGSYFGLKQGKLKELLPYRDKPLTANVADSVKERATVELLAQFGVKEV